MPFSLSSALIPLKTFFWTLLGASCSLTRFAGRAAPAFDFLAVFFFAMS
jgi:hypothetical protein